MPNEKDLNGNINADVTTMQIVIKAKAARTAISIKEFIRLSVLNGGSRESIKAELLKDLNEGGRIFGEFRNSIRATSNGVVNRFRDSGSFAELGYDKNYRWVAVLVNTCPDCLSRHGQVKTMIEWEAFGLPRTGHTRCKENCKCVLLPEDSTVLEPIIRNRKQ